MRIKHLFNQVFNLDSALVYKKGPEKSAGTESAEKQKLKPAEMKKEMEKVARRHVDAAKTLVEQVKLQSLSPKAKKYVEKVKGNIENLEKALKYKKVTMNVLKASQKTMHENVGKGLAPLLRKQVEAGDPLAVDVTYEAKIYGTDVELPETVLKAQTDVLRVVHDLTKYAPSTPSTVGWTLANKYNRELTDLAAARQLKRNRGEMPKEKDANLRVARELSDTIRLYDSAVDGKYVQEKPKDILRRRARLYSRVLRQSKVRSLSAGQATELGPFVSIQKASSGDAYLLSVAEGGSLKGSPYAIPVTTVIDLGFEKKQKSLESKIARAEKKAEKEGGFINRSNLMQLKEEYDALETADYDDFPANAAANANKVAENMYESLAKVA